MGGVQFSTLYLIEELRLYENIEAHLFLPKEGKFSKLCREKLIQYSFYHPRSKLSTSISLFYDLIRIPNPIAWIWNIFIIFDLYRCDYWCIVYNNKSIFINNF